MNVNGVNSGSPVQKIVNNPIQKQLPTEAQAPTRATDRLELSGGSHLLQALKSNDVRGDKVSSIKAQIANGTYDDDHKLDGAIDKLLDELNK
jgi:anti-sigma28 factor (negative regulator of flagellin synthesis)